MTRLALLSALFVFVAGAHGQALEVVNNQPFPIDMPWLVRGIKVPANAPAQQIGDDAMVMVDVPAGATVRPLERTPPAESNLAPTLTPADNGVALKLGNADLGRLSWAIVLHTIDKVPTTQEAAETKKNFAGDVAAMELTFKKTGGGSFF